MGTWRKEKSSREKKNLTNLIPIAKMRIACLPENKIVQLCCSKERNETDSEQIEDGSECQVTCLP